MGRFGFTFSGGGNRYRDRSSGSRHSPRGNRGGARTRFRPRLDALEARTMLSNVVTVTNDHDSGTGSLRAAINSATSGEIIEFAKSAVRDHHLDQRAAPGQRH